MPHDVLQDLLTAFVAGDRDGAANAAKQALDQYIHDFLFPEDSGMADDVLAPMPDDTDSPLDVVDEPIPAIDDNGELNDLDVSGLDTDLDADLDANLGGDDLGGDDLGGDDLDPALESAAPGVDDSIEDLGSDISDDNDVTIDALAGDDLNLDAPVDGGDLGSDPGTDELGDGEPRTVVDVVVDPEQGDDMVKACKIMYSDGTDFTFFTLASDVDQVCATVKDAVCATPTADAGEVIAELAKTMSVF